LGATHVIDYHDFAQELLRRTGGRRPDVIFDSVGGATARTGLGLLARGGRIVCFGVAGLAGRGWPLPRAIRLFLTSGLIHPLFLLRRSKGYLGLNVLEIADARPELIGHALRETVALQARGTIAPLTDRAFPAAEVGAAHAHVESRASMGKVVLGW